VCLGGVGSWRRPLGSASAGDSSDDCVFYILEGSISKLCRTISILFSRLFVHVLFINKIRGCSKKKLTTPSTRYKTKEVNLHTKNKLNINKGE
jgi:hypothetical protein